MAVDAVPCIFGDELKNHIKSAKLLVVGAGGIGCEVLKNLALSGFQDIEIIDLDTIDVSNLNRQFLFRKEHVGKPKAVVAKESILSFNPNIKINATHDSITKQEYGVNFFKKFNIVLNALDNRAARNHVNRLCLAAEVPLIESGTAGYSGQVELIKKGETQCYECQPKPAQKSFPGCTIRNTPSEPVHCIVWAKHLFNQLFGEDDPDQDVSPDAEDPEAKTDKDKISMTDSGNVARKSTRQWAQENEYDPKLLFNKFFNEDIKYLLEMKNLWVSRKQPTPLTWDEAVKSSDEDDNLTAESVKTADMKIWSLNKCAQVFSKTIEVLKKELQGNNFLVWDKDDKSAMDFVTACANIRSHIFSIPKQSRFSTKSIAGSIIPAIATANAIIAGLVVLQTFRILAEEYEKCTTVYLRRKSKYSKVVLAADKQLQKPNPNCHVCSPKPVVNVYVDLNKMSLKEFESEILKNQLNMIAPDAMLDSSIVISSEDEGMENMQNKKLIDVMKDGSILKVDDFQQSYELEIIVHAYEAAKNEPLYKIDLNPEEIKKNQEKSAQNGDSKSNNTNSNTTDKDSDDEPEIVETADAEEGPSSKKRKLNEESDDDLMILDEILE